ncbi:MAG: PilZ domain-containing protein [Candidatus Omnitrophota bacterium]|jgi:hypothetical protein|nr:PilZ domain-containing protein [Candidatus Omnitrophota bacterium]
MVETIDEKRRSVRYPSEESQLHFFYDWKTKVKYQYKAEKGNDYIHLQRVADCKNVSVEGLCFTSEERLNQGNAVTIEFYLTEDKKPIKMEGEVRWSRQTFGADKKEKRFDTGIKLTSIDGKEVSPSVYFDEAYHVEWSEVLESLLGTFRKQIFDQAKKRNQTNN